MTEEIAALAARAIEISEGATKTQGEIVRQQGRLRRIVRILAVSVAIDVAVSAACIVLAVNQAGVSHAIHQSQLNACALGNQFRVSQAQVWEHFIAQSTAPPGETPAQRARRLRLLAAARTYVRGHFRPVNCAVLYRQ